MRKRLHLYLLFSLLFTAFAASPQGLKISRFQGKSGALEVSVLLQTIESNIAAQMFYQVRDDLGVDTVGYLELEGKLDADNSLILKVLENEKEVFVGKLNDNSLKGIFKLLQTETSQMECEKQTTSWSDHFRKLYRNASLKLFPDEPQSPEAIIEVNLLVPSDSLISLQGSFADFYALVADSLKTTGFGQQVYFNIQDFFEQYLKLSDFEGEKGPSFQWFESIDGTIVWMNERFINLRKQIYVFTGGANGMFNVSFGLFDTETSEAVTLVKIFVSGFDNALSQKLTSKLKAKAGCIESADLQDCGYFVSEVSPSENFFISPFGIFFQYNYYEIAPRSFGTSTLFLSFDELQPFLKEGLRDSFQN